MFIKTSDKLIFILILILVLDNRILAQDTNPFPSGALSASSFEEAKSTPGNYYIGQPKISLPLFEYKSADHSWTLALNYRSNGTTTEKIASNVGMGWDISSYGVVYRSVNGTPDEFKYTKSSVLYNVGYLTTPNINTSFTKQRLDSFYYDQLDGQPDDFYYNIPEYSGKIIIDKNGDCLGTIPSSNLKISLSRTLAGKINQFLIKTPNGLVYEFSVNETLNFKIKYDNIDYSYEYSNKWYLSNVYLTFAENPATTKNIIKFDYDSYSSNQIVGRQYFYAQPPSLFMTSIATACIASGGGCCMYQYIFSNEDLIVEGTLQRLTRITFPDSTTVRFNYSSRNRCDLTSDRKLDYIAILDNTGAFTKKFGFKYSYMSSVGEILVDTCTVLDLTKRLLLKSVTEYGSNFDSLPPYLFDYDTTVKLPARNSVNTDAWGFDPISGPQPKGGAISGMLTKIKYPTGSTASYEYELNSIGWTKGSSATQTISGLRIKKIIYNEDVKNVSPVEHSFTYNLSSGESSGQVDFLPFHQFRTSQDYTKIRTCLVLADSFQHAICTNNINHSPIDPFVAGNACGYSQVTEEIKSNSISLGKTVFHYKNFKDFIDSSCLADGQGGGEFPYSPKQRTLSWGLGLPISVDVYDSSGLLLKSEQSTYQVKGAKFQTAELTALKVGLQWGPVNRANSATNGDVYKYELYYPLSGSSDLVKKVSKEYYYTDNGILTDSAINISEYKYIPDSNLIRSEIGYSSNGDTVEQITYYPFDLFNANYFYSNPGLYILKTYEVHRPIGVETWLRNQSGKYLVGSTMQNFGFSLYHNIKPSQTYSLKSVSSLSENVVPAFNPAVNKILRDSSLYVQTSNILKYDIKGNILASVGRDGVKKAFIYGYNDSKVIAESAGANYNEIFYDGFEDKNYWEVGLYDYRKAHTGKNSVRIEKYSSGELNSQSNNWLAVSLSNATPFHYSVWVYNLASGAKLSLYMKRSGELGNFTYRDSITTTAAGKWTLLEKDFLVPADVININLKITNNGQGVVWFDDVRLHPLKATMTTYAYQPLWGKTSEIDNNNRLTTYEYDGFGRLRLQRNNEGNIVKSICYGYNGQPENCNFYGNEQQVISYQRNNCSGDSSGSIFPDTIRANTIYAGSLQEANERAYQELEATAQVRANQYGSCLRNYHSAAIDADFYSNNCSTPYVGVAYHVIIPLGEYTSTISQEDADTQAWQTAQVQADAFGLCLEMVDINFIGSVPEAANYTVYLTNVATSETFEFYAYMGTGSPLTIPAGYYDVTFLGFSLSNFTFWAGCSAQYGPNASIYNTYIDGGCNSIKIE